MMSEFDRQMQDEIAADERWLATFDTPPPSAETIDRLQQVMHDELELKRRRSLTGQRASWHGVLAAAAAIALAVTIGWHSTRRHTSEPYSPSQNEFASSWLAERQQDALAMSDLDDQLSELEAWSVEETWGLGGASLFGALEEALDDLPDESPAETGASTWGPWTHDKTEVA
jgi:hypothetical protein